METKNRFLIAARVLSCIFFMVGSIVVLNGQGEQGKNPEKDFTVRIAVEEVRLDAVVLDKKRRQITDLTAGDFEIYQDNQKKEIISCKYVTSQTEPSIKPVISQEVPQVSKETPVVPLPRLDREDVHRVIAFIIDDISMDFENLHFARVGLKNFVEKQMQPGDLVAILRTSYGNSALQTFLSDREQLLARIETVHWGPNAGRFLPPETLHPIFDSQISTISYCIRAMKDIPGRKALIVETAMPVIPHETGGMPTDYSRMYLDKLNRLSDEALRAGVVIHFLDIRGLEVEGGPSISKPIQITAAPALAIPRGYQSLTLPPTNQSTGYGMLGGGQPKPLAVIETKYFKINPLPKKTGGLFVEDANFFFNGIGDVNDALKGYYLLSYAPASDTFKDDGKGSYRQIKIKVKRGGAEVHTREGFYGVIRGADKSSPPAHPLQDAIFSPFLNSGLKINLASGYVNDPESGYMLRSWLHLDGKDVEIISKDEGRFISLETVCLTSDISGFIHDSSIMEYEFGVKEENVSWVKEHGINFSLLLPIKKPGAYYYRVGVKDQTSGKIGSGYEFINIPDLKKDRLALSNIFVINNNEDASWVLTGKSKDPSKGLLVPMLQREESRPAALRSYKPGESIEYMAVVYNASRQKKAPDLEWQFLLYKDGAELMKSESQKIDLSGMSDFSRIPLRRKILLGSAMQEGDYVLQLVIKDKRKSGNDSLATQNLAFEIKAK